MTSLPVFETDGGITFDVQVVPRAARDRLGPVHGQRLKVHLTAPPVDGAANEALIALVARALGRRRHEVQILRGATGRHKTLRVAGIDRAALFSLLEDP